MPAQQTPAEPTPARPTPARPTPAEPTPAESTSALRPVRAELRATLSLAWPLALSFGGNQLLGLVDTAVAGRLGATAIAATGLGASIYFACSILAIGTLMALDPVASQALGAGRTGRARQALREAVRLAVVLAVPSTVALALVHGPSLRAAGVDEATRVEVGAYLWARGPSIVALLVHVAQRSYLQARHHARPVLWGTIVANLVNVPLSILLAFGDRALVRAGLPAVGFDGWGVFGLGLASTVVMVAQVAVLWVALRGLPAPEDAPPPTLAGVRSLLRVGWPIGLAHLFEGTTFVVATVLAGGFGAAVSGGHNVAIQLASFTFTLCYGLGAATAVRVGHAVGRGDPAGTRRAGLVGVGTGVAIMACGATAFALAPEGLARLVSSSPEVIAAAVPLLRIAAVFQIFDGLQAVASGALRGAGDTHGAMRLALVGHWVVGLPVAVALAFGLGWGARGLWWGLTAGLAFAGLTMLARFAVVSRRTRALAEG